MGKEGGTFRQEAQIGPVPGRDFRRLDGTAASPDYHRPERSSSAKLAGKSMDLGISGRKAIVCASSRGLGRACAMALAQAGCEVVVNGRDETRLAATAEEIRAKTGSKVIAVTADVADPAGQAALMAACPE